MNNIYTREYIHNMTFSLLCYISARDNKGTLVQLNQERRNFITPDNCRDNNLCTSLIHFRRSISTQYMASCPIVLASFDDAAATSHYFLNSRVISLALLFWIR